MATLALILSAISAVASVAALAIVLLVRNEVLKLRSRNTQTMLFDSRLGVSTSNPEELRQYRDSFARAAEPTPEARAAALEDWKLGSRQP